MVITDYVDYNDFQDYIKYNFIIDNAECTDILTTLTKIIVNST